MFLQANFPVAGFLGDFFLFFIPWLVRFPPPTPRFVTLHQLHAAEGFQSHSETLLL